MQNTIRINRSSTADGIELYTTLAHEGYPGHLYQTVYSSLVCDTQTLPIRKLFSYGGYVEGWAYYTERISYEYAAQVLAEAEGSLGSSYPAALLCTLLAQQRDLQINLFCLLDLSLHYYGAEESELLRSLESFGLSEEQSERIYDYLRTAPAVYLKYYVGYLEMNALKKRAELQWSDNFSLLRFHRFVLEAGPSDFENLTKRLKQTGSPSQTGWNSFPTPDARGEDFPRSRRAAILCLARQGIHRFLPFHGSALFAPSKTVSENLQRDEADADHLSGADRRYA